eukprot:4740507-Karenia_brevis.AAC.1
MSQSCYLCGCGRDAQDHVFVECPVVLRAKTLVATPDWNPESYTLAQHNLMELPSNQVAHSILKLNSAILRVRALSKRRAFNGHLDAALHI